MSSALLNILELNEHINYSLVGLFILLYIIIFWAVISMWVFKDSSKRYEERWKAYAFCVGNFLLGFPFLILYIIIRPSDEDVLDNCEYCQGGVNVPIVNFIGEDGVNISFNLRIDTNKFNNKENDEMKIDISFDSNDKNKQIVENGIKKEVVDEKAKDGTRLINFFQKLKKTKGDIEEGKPEVKDDEESEIIKDPKVNKKNKDKKKSKSKGKKKK